MKFFKYIVLSLLPLASVAQDNPTLIKGQFLFDLTSEHLTSKPNDVDFRWYAHGISFTTFMDMPFSAHSSMAIGLGYSNQNYYSDAWLIHDEANDYTDWQVMPEDTNFGNVKVAVSQFELPLELRFRTGEGVNSEGFKFAIGIRPGWVFDVHDKYKTDDGDKYKNYNFPGVNNFRAVGTARIGYGQFTLSGYYSLTPFFNPNQGPETYQFGIGLGVIPF